MNLAQQPLEHVAFAFFACYGGDLRLREVKILLLVQQASALGLGAHISELARETGTPVESVRRQLQQALKEGLLRKVPDAEDARVSRYFATEAGDARWQLRPTLTLLDQLYDCTPVQADRQPPFGALLALIDILINGYMGSIRLRGTVVALMVFNATRAGTGVSIGEVARVTGAPAETVRRTLAKHVKMGHICFAKDPIDDRKTLVVTANPASELRRIEAMRQNIARIDWPRAGSGALLP